MILDDGGLKRVDEDRIEFFGQVEEHVFIDEEPSGAVGEQKDVADEALKIHANAGAEAGEEQAAGAEDAPELREHGAELVFVAGEVQDRGAEHGVERCVGERQVLNGGDAEVFSGQAGVQRLGESADVVDTRGIGIDGEDPDAFAEQMDEVATVAAAGIENAHGGGEIAAQDLIEDVDIDGAELFLEVEGQEKPFVSGEAGYALFRMTDQG